MRLAGPGLEGTDIFLKLENLQPTGSFKVRPAASAVGAVAGRLGPAGVCTASAGNFAQGLAWCCQELGLPCTVVAPDQAPHIKLAAIRAWGAAVITVPYTEWWQAGWTHNCRHYNINWTEQKTV